MKINKEDLNRFTWYEDIDGNEIPCHKDCFGTCPENAVTYHSMFPLEITEHMYSISWYPERKIDKIVYKIPLFKRYLDNKHKSDKRLHHIADFNCNIGIGNSDVIIAMVNSGDYTLNEAIMLWANACERCMNVLAYKYLDGADGYPEYSDEWRKCNTVCKFCKEEQNEL